MAAQAQKHVTHNEALRVLDAVVQLSVIDRDLTSPPGSPVDGDRYIVDTSATGAWAGKDGEIAAWQDNSWMFYAPQGGWICWIADEGVALGYDGSVWGAIATDASVNPTPLVGVNASADATNRLSVSSPASLFNHEGNGHQVKVNKNAVADTASFLYQTGFSGRAEIGLTGDDDFHFKVSPDGVSWKDAIQVDKASGAVTMPYTNLGTTPVSFMADGDGATTSTNGVWTKVGLVVDDNDLGDSTFAGSAVTISANDAGKWLIAVAIGMTALTVGTKVYVNGVGQKIYCFIRSDSEVAARIGSAVGFLNLSVGDVVEQYSYNNSSTQVPIASTTYMHMTRIGDA